MLDALIQWFQEPSNQQILIATVLALFIGLILGWRIRRPKETPDSITGKADKAFYKGIQYIISNDHDHAIEEFTKSVQINSDTIETYVTLGNLYRSKGDIDRAIRIRQSIVMRPNIDEEIRLSALFDLGLDYRKGGFLNRALDTFTELAKKDPSNARTYQEIERIYEELKDWENAYKTRQKISHLIKGDHQHILAHHLVEMGKISKQKGELSEALSFYSKAISTHKECVDAYLHLGDLHFSKQSYKKAISTWKRVAEVAPQFTFLAYRRLIKAYSEMDNLKPVEDFLKECVELNPDAYTHMALSRYLYNEKDFGGALKEVDIALELDPIFWEARRFKGEMLISQGKNREALEDYQELIQHLDFPYLRTQCSECGFQPNSLQWQCPQCRRWDTIRLIDTPKSRPIPAEKSGEAAPQLSQDMDE